VGNSIILQRLGEHLDEQALEVSSGLMDVMVGHRHYRIMVDCGLSPQKDSKTGRKWVAPNLAPLADGKLIDAVFITHVHGDHVGYLPAIVPHLTRNAPVFMSWTSKQMLWDVLNEGIKINKRAKTPGPYNLDQLKNIMARVKPLTQPGDFNALPGLQVLAFPAGHIPGACSFTFRVGNCNVHYSGDRCEHDQPGILGAQPLPKDWSKRVVIACADCTNCADAGSDERAWQTEMDRGAEIARRVLQQGRPVLFFTFSIHRGGAVAHELQRRGIHKIAPIFLDGGCRKFTRITNDQRNMWCDNDQLVEIAEVQEMGDRGAREELMRSGKPYVVIAPPGMGGPGGVMSGEGGYRDYVLPDKRAAIVFTGFVAPRTDGRKILDAVASRKPGKPCFETFEVQPEMGRPYNKDLPINCEVDQIRLGGHQSRRETIDWYLDMDPIAAVLNHGSIASLASLEAELSAFIPDIYRSDVQPKVEIDL